MLAQYATASDPSSGGRQMPGHYGSARAQHRVGLVAGRDPAPARGRDRPRGQDPQDRPGRDDQHGRGRRPTRATSTRGSTSRRSTSCRSSSSSRTTATRSACRPRCRSRSRTSPSRAAGYGMPGVIVDGADVLACYAAARERSPGRARRRPDADRGQGDPPDRATRRTTSRRSTAPRRSSTAERAQRRRCRASASSSRDAGVLTDEIEAAPDGRDRGRRRGRDRLRRGPARPRPGDARCATSTPTRGGAG